MQKCKKGVVENVDQSTWWIWIRACSRNFTPACIPILQQLTPIYILDGPASSMCASCTLAKMQKWHCKHKYHKYYTMQYYNYRCCPIPSVQLMRRLSWSLHSAHIMAHGNCGTLFLWSKEPFEALWRNYSRHLLTNNIKPPDYAKPLPKISLILSEYCSCSCFLSFDICICIS